jgi:predicted RNase H-like HicB family nuclease
MLLEYIDTALKKARYEILRDNGAYYGSIKGFRGVYSNARDLETCRKELREVLEEWILIRLRRNLSVPVLKGINLNLKKVA